MKTFLLLSALIFSGFQNNAPGSSAVSGTITQAGTNKPLLGVRVQLDDQLVTTTDAQGYFKLENILPGRHELSASYRGYLLAGRTGDRAGSSVRTPSAIVGTLDLASGQNIRDIHIEMAREGVISGKVLRANGAPAAGASIQVFQVFFADGHRRLIEFIADNAVTDDTGRYWLWGLPAGEYYLRASLRTTQGIVTGHYPAEAEPSTARSVSLAAGRELPNTNIVIPNPATSSTTITIAPPAGSNLLTGALYIAVPRGTDPAMQASAAVGIAASPWVEGNTLGGRPLSIKVPRPGDYDFFLAARSENTVYFGKTSVATANPSGTTPITLGNVYDLLVRVSFDSVAAAAASALPPIGLKPISDFQYLASTYSATPASSTSHDSPGMFTLPKISEGEYTIASSSPPGFYVADVRHEGKSVLDGRVRVDGEKREPLELILRSNGGTITGTVHNAARQGLGFHRVVLVPNAPHRSTFAWYKTTTSDYHGGFEFADVPPGDYKLFSWSSSPDGAWTSASYLLKYESEGTPVKVAAGQRLENLTVSLIP